MDVHKEIAEVEQELIRVHGQIKLYECIWGVDANSKAARAKMEELREKLEDAKRLQGVFDNIDARLQN